MSRYKWILDAGHGGMLNGKYTTAPGKMFVFQNDGYTFLEGVNNRAIAARLIPRLEKQGIDYALVYDDQVDTPLGVRVNRANVMHAKDRRGIYLSIHSDAMPEGSHGRAHGMAVFTSPGETASDKVAEIFAHVFTRDITGFTFRKNLGDGKLDHEEKFYVLVKTECPAVLFELGFYDNRKEAEYLASAVGQETLAQAIFDGIMQCETLKPV